MKTPQISGFLPRAKKTAAGRPYTGRFTCHEVQWTGTGSEALATFTVTADELADAADARLLWTDQDVQRGIRPGLSAQPPREIALSDGYPDPTLYIFDHANADDIVEKLLEGQRVFLSPLVWNLRPGAFQAYWREDAAQIYIYDGRIYLPDSHHRQQAIAKAVRTWREDQSAYPRFTPEKQFKVELYFLSRDDEGNYFFDKNQRPRPTAMSKAYDLTTLDDLSRLAKMVIGKAAALAGNVNRVTDRLSKNNPQVVTLSTLREMMKTLAPSGSVDQAEMDGLATVAATFYDMLAEVRPELGVLSGDERRAVRQSLIVDAAVMMHGYAALMRDFNDAIPKSGIRGASAEWSARLGRLSSTNLYAFEGWSGDLFDKMNPLWRRVGVVKPGRDGRSLTVLNTGAARGECARVLRQFAALEKPPSDLMFLASR